jgi:hypothetical protein
VLRWYHQLFLAVVVLAAILYLLDVLYRLY